MQKQQQKQQEKEKEDQIATKTTGLLQLEKEDDDNLYRNFIHSIKTQTTRRNYLIGLKYYMKFLGVEKLRELIAENKHQKIIESDIKEYLVYLRNNKKLSHDTANTYLAPIRKF